MKKSAGELAKKAASDNTKYDLKEVSHASTDDLRMHIEECIRLHNPIFDMDEYCVCFVLAKDPLLTNLIRRKFFAMPYLPSPRPNQTVFLYNKKTDNLKRLWVLPDAITMETLYEFPLPSEKWRSMQIWSKAFYDGCFYELIRTQHGINMLSEEEMSKSEKLVESSPNSVDAGGAQPFDFTKIRPKNIIDSNVVICH